MVVDDEPDIGEFVCTVAKRSGFNPEKCDYANDFVERYRDNTTVVVLDLFMPDTDGIELVRFLGKRHSSTAIILMSGVDRGVLHSAQELAIELGLKVLGILGKPFRQSELTVLLDKVPRDVEGETKRKSLTESAISEEELRQAIANRELTAFYQPQVEIGQRSIVGAEALVRWRHPQRGLVPPGLFIPLAEETGLVDDIAYMMLHEATGQCRAWHDAGMDIRVAVNLSPGTLKDLNFPEKLLRLMDEQGLDPGYLVIEVTETAMMDDLAKSLDILTRIRMKGFQLSIDDFGTGHSSLEKLARIPFTELKIDRSFIQKINQNSESRTIAKLSVMLAHELNMTAVAEGIETKEVWNTLDELECDEGQGYWMGRPMPAEEFPRWSRDWLGR